MRLKKILTKLRSEEGDKNSVIRFSNFPALFVSSRVDALNPESDAPSCLLLKLLMMLLLVVLHLERKETGFRTLNRKF